MEEEGVVVEVRGAAAVVKLEETGGCGSCASAGTCKAGSGGRLLEAENRASASAGDRVMVSIPGGSFIRASFIVYMVPVIMLFAGAFLGGEYGPSIYGGLTADSWQALGGVLFLALSAAGLRLYDRMVKKVGQAGAVVSRVI